MNLVIDVGNTTIVVAIFDKQKLVKQFVKNNDFPRSEDEYFAYLKEFFKQINFDVNQIDKILYSSVCPEINLAIKEAIARLTPVTIETMDNFKDDQIFSTIPSPHEIGDDLIADIYAGIKKYGCPLLIVDLGTASKVLFVNKDTRFVGCNILPGLMLSTQSLSKNASLLPNIELKAPKTVLTTNTIDAMNTGLVYGHVDMVEGMIARYKKETGIEDLKVVITGGISRLLKPLMNKDYIYNMDLTIEGLNYLLGE